jgi:hypothetical protein
MRGRRGAMSHLASTSLRNPLPQLGTVGSVRGRSRSKWPAPLYSESRQLQGGTAGWQRLDGRRKL